MSKAPRGRRSRKRKQTHESTPKANKRVSAPKKPNARSKSNSGDGLIGNPFEAQDDHLTSLAVDIFQQSGCLEPLHVDRSTVECFVKLVQQNYNDNPYHNWRHAFHVFYNAYRFIRPASQRFTPLDVFTLLVSAICHDLDHPGVPNKYLVAHKSPLAKRYKTSPLEHHSITRTKELLETDEANMLQNFSVEDREAFFRLLESLILATDISEAKNIEKVTDTWAKYGKDFQNTSSPYECRESVLQMVLLCADVGIVHEPFDTFIHGVRLLYLENIESMKTLTSADFYVGQSNFLSRYASPMYERLNSCDFLHKFDTFANQLSQNQSTWSQLTPEECSEYLQEGELSSVPAPKRKQKKSSRANKKARSSANGDAPSHKRKRPQRKCTLKVTSYT